jgi:hypothetical protein
MFTPSTKHTVCLFTVWVEGDGIKIASGPEMFQTFYGTDPLEVERYLGPRKITPLTLEQLGALPSRIDDLMNRSLEKDEPLVGV